MSKSLTLMIEYSANTIRIARKRSQYLICTQSIIQYNDLLKPSTLRLLYVSVHPLIYRTGKKHWIYYMHISVYAEKKNGEKKFQMTNAFFHLNFGLLMIIYEICLLHLFYISWMGISIRVLVQGAYLGMFIWRDVCVQFPDDIHIVQLRCCCSCCVGIRYFPRASWQCYVVVFGLGTEKLNFFSKTKYQKYTQIHTHIQSERTTQAMRCL